MFLNSLYYQIKPLIPRRVQIALRRQLVMRKRARYAHIWPIHESAAKPPEGWQGWPDGKKFAFVLTHDVETAAGRDKVLHLAELEKKLGFRSSFNFVPEEYSIIPEMRHYLEKEGFEVGVHGIRHGINLYESRETFEENAVKINHYLSDWNAVGFRSPSMYHNLDWIGDLNVEYDSSTFDTDPFEPQPDGVTSIFPFWVPGNNGHKGYVELPYTLPQDFTLFVMMREKGIDIWKKKLDWIAEKGGVALFITHPDYMSFGKETPKTDQYPSDFYAEFLQYVENKYQGQYWAALPCELARHWKLRTLPQSITRPPHRAVEIIDPVKDSRWDAFVENHPFGWICHLSGWKQTIEKSFGHIKGHFLAIINEKGEIEAGLAVYDIRSWLTGRRLVSIPFATLSDLLISSKDDFELLFAEAVSLSCRLNSSQIHIKTLFSSKFIDGARLDLQNNYITHHLSLNGKPEDLMKTFHLTAVRQMIKKIPGKGLTLCIGETEEDLRAFFILYRKTRKRLGLPTQPYRFFRILWEVFVPSKQVVLYLAKKKDRLVGGQIYFKFNGRYSMEFEGWEKSLHRLAPNHFLIWEAMNAAQREGYRIFDFGRTFQRDEGLKTFKSRWGTEVSCMPEYYYPKKGRVESAPREDSAKYKLVRELCHRSPDMVHRIISEFCYRHLG